MKFKHLKSSWSFTIEALGALKDLCCKPCKENGDPMDNPMVRCCLITPTTAVTVTSAAASLFMTLPAVCADGLEACSAPKAQSMDDASLAAAPKETTPLAAKLGPSHQSIQ